MGKWIIYDHAFPNGKHYIGKTSTAPIVRWGTNGQRYKTQPLLWNAIKKYGWNNIEHNILLTDLTEDEANKKEQEMIEYYHSYYLDELGSGYNMTRGGEGSCQLDLEKIEELFLQGLRPADIARQLNYYDAGVCGHLKNMGYQLANGSSKKINQFDLEGNFIKTYDSCAQAGEENKIDYKLINGVVRGIAKTSGGYQWKYFNEDDIINGIGPVKRERGGCKKKKINQFDLNGNYIRTYNSLAEAAKDTGAQRSNIRMAAQGKIHTSMGYKWAYCEE